MGGERKHFFGNSVTWHPERSTRFVFMRRDNGQVDAVVDTDPVFVSHQVSVHL